MQQAERDLRLAVSVRLESSDVNTMEQAVQESRPELAVALLEQVQEKALEESLGHPWRPLPGGRSNWTCPRCASGVGFRRKGSRKRSLLLVAGKVRFRLWQVQCRQCGHVFAPGSSILGLRPYQRSSSVLEERGVALSTQMAYRPAAKLLEDSGAAPVTATALHRWVQQRGSGVEFPASLAQGRPLYFDATKVKAGKKPRGLDLQLGLSLRGRIAKPRPQLLMDVVHFAIASSWDGLAQRFADVRPSLVVYDGDEPTGRLIPALARAFPDIPKQRCLWHLTYDLPHIFWFDGLTKKASRPWRAQVQRLLYRSYGPTESASGAEEGLRQLASTMATAGYTHAAHYLETAAPEAFTFLECSLGPFTGRAHPAEAAPVATSPAERQMREVNRRTDVGARWSPDGAANLLALRLLRTFYPNRWAKLWHKGSNPTITVTSQGATPNVNTS